jgi:hypothetical protein
MTLELCARIQDDVRVVCLCGHFIMQRQLFMRTMRPACTAYPNAHDGKFRMNSLGFRGPELDSESETIVCFGASETFDPNESADHHDFPRQLETDLKVESPCITKTEA